VCADLPAGTLSEWSMDTALKVRGEECMEKKAKKIAKKMQK
jgi:hypothetical protein